MRTVLSVQPAATRDAVGRKRNTEHRIAGQHQRAAEFAGGDVPQLNFAEAGGRSAAGRQQRSVLGKRQREDAFGETGKPLGRRAAIQRVQQDFAIARDGKRLAIGRKRQCSHDGRLRVDRRLVEGNSVARFRRRIVLRAGGHPVADQRQLFGGQRRLAKRHLRLHLAREVFHNQRRRRTSFAAGRQPLISGQIEIGRFQIGLVAALALALQDGPDLPEIARFRGLQLDSKARQPSGKRK